MAVSGLSTFLHAELKNTGLYGSPAKTAGAIEAKPDIKFNSAPIYSDNSLKHKDTSFQEGTIALTVDYANKGILSPILGRKMKNISVSSNGKTESSVKHVSNSADKPVYVGFGYIVNDLDVENDKPIYTVKFFYKVQFQPDAADVKTKEGSITYTYSTLTGTIFELDNGDWCEEEDFESLQMAVAYLYSLFEQTCIIPSASLESGTYTGQQSVTLTAGNGETIKYTTNGLTPGTSSKTYTTPVTISESTMLKAISTKSGYSDSGVAQYEYIINS